MKHARRKSGRQLVGNQSGTVDHITDLRELRVPGIDKMDVRTARRGTIHNE